MFIGHRVWLSRIDGDKQPGAIHEVPRPPQGEQEEEQDVTEAIALGLSLAPLLRPQPAKAPPSPAAAHRVTPQSAC